jgi:predicted RNA-binding protein with PUA-like domain
MPAHWLVKTEPSTYAFADLVREGRTTWDGVSNALALIHLRAMKKGDLVLVYHSGQEKAIVGLARVAAGPRPDPKAHDPKLVVIDLEPVTAAKSPVPLAAVKAEASCRDLALVRQSRLSVTPVADASWAFLVARAGLAAPG